MTNPDCLFCRIVAGEIPADVVHRTEDLLAFRDISPQAPVHILVIPTEHITSLEVALDDHQGVLGEMMLAARDIARAEDVAEAGYRTVMNTGDDGGQTVRHMHLHLLGGRALTWPPG
ncbi:MAG: histidine triad nucleotide-binding protein [Gemmatimonadetes bacterium]|nr:histidine triad nucleotide-binding protein [Gemmatimonadota bacterium]